MEEEECDDKGTVCATLETEYCYTKYEEECETVYKERCSTEYELECTTGIIRAVSIFHNVPNVPCSMFNGYCLSRPRSCWQLPRVRPSSDQRELKGEGNLPL